MTDTPTETKVIKADPSDVEKNKAMGILAYIIFFLPLLAAKDSKFAMFHANQGLLVFLLAIAANIVGTIIPFLGWFLILPLGNLAVLAFTIMGILNAANGEMKELPLIGKYQLLK
jgi:uncharacterized membrane protein